MKQTSVLKISWKSYNLSSVSSWKFIICHWKSQLQNPQQSVKIKHCQLCPPRTCKKGPWSTWKKKPDGCFRCCINFNLRRSWWHVPSVLPPYTWKLGTTHFGLKMTALKSQYTDGLSCIDRTMTWSPFHLLVCLQPMLLKIL